MDFEEAKQRVTALREQIEYHSRRKSRTASSTP